MRTFQILLHTQCAYSDVRLYAIEIKARKRRIAIKQAKRAARELYYTKKWVTRRIFIVRENAYI